MTTEANNSLLSTVENDIIPELKRLSKDERATLVFDREGWSPARFLKWKKFGIDVLTYRKGKYEPWPKDCFIEATSQVRGESGNLYAWGTKHQNKTKKTGSERSGDCVTTDIRHRLFQPDRIFQWKKLPAGCFFDGTRKNYFKYMREEYSLDHLVSRDVEQADVERMVPNPPRKKQMSKRMLKTREAIEKKKENYATKAVDNDEKKCRTMRGFNISNFGLKTDIKWMEDEIEALKTQIKQLPDKVKIKEILNEDEIVRLETEKKRLTDTIKMACYRAETELIKTIEQTQCFSRGMDEGRNFIKNVFQQPADIIPHQNNGRMEVHFHTMSTKKENKALKVLCDIVNKEKFSYPGTKLKLVFMTA